MTRRQEPRVREAIGALGATTTLLVVVVGLPVALVVTIGSPLPASPPSIDALLHALRYGQIAPETLLRTLAVVLWAVWALLVVSLAVESAAIVRGTIARALPGLGGLQLLAARLLAAVMLLASVTTRAGATPVPARAPAPVTVPTAADHPTLGDPVPADATDDSATGSRAAKPTAPATRPWTVRRNDSLWAIAEHALGDGHRWKEIVDLNADRVQPDGRRLGRDGTVIHPGWRLLLPADPAEAARANHVTVEPGDDLWGLAARHLDDGARWTELFAQNRGRRQADGRSLRDPDLVLPGWTLQLPPRRREARTAGRGASRADVRTEHDGGNDRRDHRASAVPVPTADDRDAPAADRARERGEQEPVGDRPPTDEQVPAERGLKPEREPKPERAPAAERPPASGRAQRTEHAPAATPAASAERSGSTASSPPPLPSTPDVLPGSRSSGRATASAQPTAALRPVAAPSQRAHAADERAALIFGGAMLAAGLLGLVSRQRRHWLRRRPLEAPLGAVDPDAAELERWLRSMNEQDLRHRRDRVLRALSDLLAHHGVRPVVRAIELGDEVTLRVDGDAPPPPGITASSGARHWVLPPEFDVAGVPDDAEPYLVALVSCGVLPSGALLQLNLMAADAVGIVGEDAVVDDVMTSWATELATAGASDDVEVIVVDPPHPLVERIDRIAVAADIADAVARVRWLTDDADGRCVVLVGRQGHGSTEVAPLLEAAGHPHVGAVLSGEVPAGVTVEIDAAQHVHLSTEEVTLSAPQWLTPDDWDRFGDLLRGAGPAGLGDPVPSPLQPVAAPEPEPVRSPADRSVGVLGALTIDGTPSPLDPTAAGLLTYLVLHPTGASPAALDELLWPRRAADHGRLSRAVAAVEAAFGEDRPVIVHTDDGRLEAHDDVACDLLRCEELARGLGRLDPATRARRRYLALELVRGAPFADGIAWAHADGTALRATGLIVDLAHRLAAHALTIGDVERASWAVDRGLRAAPTNELLHRDRMRVADARGDTAALDAAMDAVRQLAAADGGRALPATERCYRELRAAAVPYARATEDAG